MDFQFSDEQKMIRDSAQKFVSEHCGGNRLNENCENGAISEDRWRALAEHGFLSLGQPENYGGIGGPAEIAIVSQEFGRGPLPEPYFSTALFASTIIAHAGTDSQKAALLPAIGSGRTIISVAYREPESPLDEPRCPTTATREGDRFILNGRKCLVLAAPSADWLLVSATVASKGKSAGETTLFLVSPRQGGVTVKSVPLVDGSRCGEIVLNGVNVSAQDRVGAEGEGAAALLEGLRYAMLAACGEMAGAAARSLEIAADFLKVRVQFGTPLSGFQALRHKIADMAIDCEMARSSVLKLVASFQDPEQHDPAMTLSLAKFMLDEIGYRVCSQAVQLHGAIGLTQECAIGRYFARATVIRSLYGSTSSHLAEYARLLMARLAATVDKGKQAFAVV